jgi:hypothetical protein
VQFRRNVFAIAGELAGNIFTGSERFAGEFENHGAASFSMTAVASRRTQKQ